MAPPHYDAAADEIVWMWRGNVEHYQDRIVVADRHVGYVLRAVSNGAAVGVRVVNVKQVLGQPPLAEALSSWLKVR